MQVHHPTADGFGPLYVIRRAFAATGGSGTVIDALTIPVPAGMRVLECQLIIVTVLGAATATFRDAAAGGGNAVSGAISVATAGRARDSDATLTATRTVAANGNIYLRVDRSVAGEAIIFLQGA